MVIKVKVERRPREKSPSKAKQSALSTWGPFSWAALLLTAGSVAVAIIYAVQGAVDPEWLLGTLTAKALAFIAARTAYMAGRGKVIAQSTFDEYNAIPSSPVKFKDSPSTDGENPRPALP